MRYCTASTYWRRYGQYGTYGVGDKLHVSENTSVCTAFSTSTLEEERTKAIVCTHDESASNVRPTWVKEGRDLGCTGGEPRLAAGAAKCQGLSHVPHRRPTHHGPQDTVLSRRRKFTALCQVAFPPSPPEAPGPLTSSSFPQPPHHFDCVAAHAPAFSMVLLYTQPHFNHVVTPASAVSTIVAAPTPAHSSAWSCGSSAQRSGVGAGRSWQSITGLMNI